LLAIVVSSHGCLLTELSCSASPLPSSSNCTSSSSACFRNSSGVKTFDRLSFGIVVAFFLTGDPLLLEFLTFENTFGNAISKELNRSNGVIIARMTKSIGSGSQLVSTIAITESLTHWLHAQRFFLFRIDNKHSIRQPLHIFNAAKKFFLFFPIAF
jgi:hypothetical protein